MLGSSRQDLSSTLCNQSNKATELIHHDSNPKQWVKWFDLCVLINSMCCVRTVRCWWCDDGWHGKPLPLSTSTYPQIDDIESVESTTEMKREKKINRRWQQQQQQVKKIKIGFAAAKKNEITWRITQSSMSHKSLISIRFSCVAGTDSRRGKSPSNEAEKARNYTSRINVFSKQKFSIGR